MDTLINIAVVSGIAAGLAAVLVIAQKFIGNYGECDIEINGDKHLKVEGGSSLLESLSANKMFIPSACGGRGTCGYCKLKVLDGAGPIMPTEEPFLTKEDRAENVRLACQIKVRNNLRIEIPEHLFNVREFSGTCTRITDLTYDIKQFRLECAEGATVNYTPGQYVQLFCPVYGKNDEVYRAYSIASDPQDNAIELLIRRVPGGTCTTYCFEHLKEGDPVHFNGPYGEFRLSENDVPAIFVAGGSGMAPMRNLLYQMKNSGSTRKVTYYFGGNTVADMFYADLMKSFETDLVDFTFVPVVAKPAPDESWDGEVGFVTQAIEKNMQDLSGHEAYLCGSPGMIEACVTLLTKLGMPKDSIFYDKFA